MGSSGAAVPSSIAGAITAAVTADNTVEMDTYVPLTGDVEKAGGFRLVDSFLEIKGAGEGAVVYNAGGASNAAWQINKQGAGRLFHLVANDVAGTEDLIALGLDAGVTNGLLVANKAGGTGVIIGNHASATKPGFAVTNYSASSTAGTVFNNSDLAATIKFVANNGQAFKNAVTTLGDTTLTCATAAFTAGDVGQIILSATSIDGAGVDTGTTIATYVSPTEITLSKPAVSTSTQVNIIVMGRTYSTTQRFLEYIGPTAVPFQIVKVARTEYFHNVDFYPVGGSTTNQSYVRQANTMQMYYQYNGSNYTNTRWQMKAADTIALRMYDPAAAGSESVYTDMILAKKGSLGFFGTLPVAKPTGVTVDAAGIHGALVSLGLIAA